MDEFLEQFLVECRELVEQATDDLLALEQTPEDRARVDSVFRGFHTLKGAAGIVDFAAMGRALHAAEDVLGAVRAGEAPVTPDLVSDCLTCLDQVVQWLEQMEAAAEVPADADPAADRIVARFAEAPAQAGSEVPASSGPPDWLAGLPHAPGARTAVRYAPDADCFFRGEDPLALVAALPGLRAMDISPAQPWPELDGLDPFACNMVFTAVSDAAPQDIAAALRQVADQVEIHPLAPAGGSAPEQLPETAVAVLDAQRRMVRTPSDGDAEGRLGAARRVVANVLRRCGFEAQAEAAEAAEAGGLAALIDGLLDAPAEPSREPPTEPGTAAPALADAAVRGMRVEVERLDALVKLTGELTVAKNALGHIARQAERGADPAALAASLKAQHALLDRLTAELQHAVVGMRVLPLRHAFQRFPRVVREISNALGRPVRLVTEGETTEADKAIVEALFEPLLHVLRNALDHGVEDPAERLAAGKPATATIRLSARRTGDQVLIEVADDGRGLDPAALRDTAARRGLGDADALAALDDDAALELIFLPGFSTAAAVSALSGRGVGMDAVRAAVARLGGRAAIASTPGSGTTVRFVLPFTVMMTRVMTVEACGQVFGIPMEAVVETLRLPPEKLLPVGAGTAIVVRGQTAPLVDLAGVLGLATEAAVPRAEANVVVVSLPGQVGGLRVDRFGERLDIMLKPLDGLLSGMRGVAGTTVMGDGRVLIVLDLEALLA